MAEETVQEVSVDEIVVGKTTFGNPSNPSPKWAIWVFRIFFYVSSVTTVIVTTDDEIPATAAKRIVKYLAYATMAIHLGARLTGVKVNEDEFKK